MPYTASFKGQSTLLADFNNTDIKPKHIKCSQLSFSQKVVRLADNINLIYNAWLRATMPFTVSFKGWSTLLADFYNTNLKTKTHKMQTAKLFTESSTVS
jgi:hypothetical protein